MNSKVTGEGAVVVVQKKTIAIFAYKYSGGTVCQLLLETSEFCRKYKLNIPRVSKWFPVHFYMYFQDFLSFLLYGWSAKQEHLATSGKNVV